MNQAREHHRELRFLHSADWQLGMRRHFLDAHAQPRFDEARLDAIGRMAEIAKRENCAFAVVAGDVFESNQVLWRTVGGALQALEAFECPVYLLPANHDPLDAASVYRSPAFRKACPSHVHVLEDRSARVIDAAGSTVEIVGVPWLSKRHDRDLVGDALAALEPRAEGWRVMVAHGDAGEGFAAGDDGIDLDAVAAALGDGRLHYLALGDRHSTTEVAPRVWYSGAPEVTAYREVDAGNALVVALTPDSYTVTPHRVGRWNFVEHRVVLQDRHDLAGLQSWVDDLPDKLRTSLKLRIEGAITVEDASALDTWIDEHRPLFAAIEERRKDLSVVVDDLSEWALSGFLRAGADELAEGAEGDGDAADTARDALALLHRLAQSRKEGAA